MKYYMLSLSVVLVDQLSKLLVHVNMKPGDEIMILGDWFRLHYVLNPGIAFGMEFDFVYGKLLLTIFRILAAIGIACYLYYLTRNKGHQGVLLALSFILAGALGNVIDSTFYGVILGNAPANALSPWLHGQVIDMFYFPIYYGTFPEWLPIWGSQTFQFFRPVFNLADASIFIGVAFVLVLQNKYAFIGPAAKERVALKSEAI